MAVDDVQTPISPLEEKLIKLWRKLNERDRMAYYRTIETEAMQAADPAPDQKVKEALGPVQAPKEKKRALTTKRS